MKKSTKIWLIIAASLLLIGTIIVGVAMTMLQWNFSKLTTHRYVENDYEITESFTNISVVTDTADIVFLPSENNQCRVECYEMEKARHTVTVEDGTLVIRHEDTRKWYEYIGINFSSQRITVYLPQGQYGNLAIRASTGDVTIRHPYSFADMQIALSTGDIQVAETFAETMYLSVSTGTIEAADLECSGVLNVFVTTGKSNLKNITCQYFSSGGGTGDVSLKNVVATGTMTILRSTGDVTLSGCDAAEILITTDTGDVTGTLLSEKIFFAHTDTGRVEVPNTNTGGRCEITTDTGNIRIRISK